MFITRDFSKKLNFSLLFLLSLLFVIASITFGSNKISASNADQRPREEKSYSTDLKNTDDFSSFLGLKSFDFLTNNLINSNNISAAPDSAFVVNSSGDSEDIVPGDGICADTSGNCTLRAAIQEANATAGTDEITFNLASPAIIQLNSDLSPAELVISEAVTINGSGARLLTVNGNSNTTSGIFNITATVTTMTNISGITIANSGGRGINNDGRLTLTDVNIKGNGIGIYNTSRLILNRVLINNNAGGGIYITSPSVVNISNTTITSNSSTDFGGGINSFSTDVTLNNVTISNNTAATSGGGIYYNNSAPGMNVRNTIIADNMAPAGPDIFSSNIINGTFTSRGNNLIGKSAINIGFTNGVNNDQVGTTVAPVNPLLGPLQNNGGQTDTRALLTNSSAKNAGHICVINNSCTLNNPSTSLLTDQRGNNFPRFFETAVDIGAFESFYPTPSITSLVPNSRGTGTSSFELTVNGSNFVANSIVQWNGQNRVTTFVSNTQIKAQILATDVQTAGQYPVTVTNPQPGGGVSEAINFTVADCSYAINPTTAPFTATGGSGNIAVTTNSGCGWTAVSNDPSWITVTAGSPGSGNGAVAYTVAANNGPARTGTITIAGKTFTVTQENGCAFTITPTTMNFTATGGSSSVTVTTPNQGCQWNSTVPTTTPEWITITANPSGTGDKTLTYTVAANNGPARSKTLTIAGKTFTVTQENGCAFTITPTTMNFTAAGGTGTVMVTTPNQQCQWTATVTPSTPQWITITGGASQTGDGAVNYTVAANNGPARTGTITIAGKTFTVTQENGCTFTITPTTMNFTATGGSSSVTVTTPNQQCQWTATVTPSTPEWITITSGASQTGDGTVSYTVTANNGPARSKTLTIAGKTFTVTQENGCAFTITPTTMNFTATGGSNSVAVTTNSGCGWTAVSNDPSWITVTAGSPGSGNGAVAYTVAANNGPARTGTITIAGKTFTVTQENGCAFTITPTTMNFTATGGSSSVTVTTPNQGCQWNSTVPTTTPEWITITANPSGTGDKTLTYTVAANNGPARSKTLTIAGKTFTVTQENGCAFTITPTTMNFTAAGGTGTVMVTTPNQQCQWTATVAANSPWITITSGSPSPGNGTVTYSVTANDGPTRTGTITIAGIIFTVTQNNGCTFTITPTNQTFPAAGGTGTVMVTTPNQQCQWTATVTPSTPQWITITSISPGPGNGTVTYTVALNEGPERTNTITIAGQIFTVTQLSLLVTNLNDSGSGSLRQAVINANATPALDVINFQPSLSGTIFLTSGEIVVASNTRLKINGLGANVLTISGSNASRIFYTNNAIFALSDISLIGGNGEGTGSYEDYKIGGAIYAYQGSLSLNNVYVKGNIVPVPASLGSRSIGGGVFIFDGTNHSIQNSTFSDNRSGNGGGIYSQGGLIISNSTLSDNIADGQGGAILSLGNTELRNVTITNNKALGTGPTGAGISIQSGSLKMSNTIIAENIGPEISYLAGEVIPEGNNLIGDSPGDSANTNGRIDYGPSDILDTPPLLTGLAMYGGKTPTVALSAASPAVNKGNNSSAPTTDQRGSPRIIGAAIDIGAFENNLLVSPSNTALPNGSINVSYPETSISASRINGTNPNEQFSFVIATGSLPTGMSLDSFGNILGTPTSGGPYTFSVKATGTADGMSGANKYTMNVGCSYQINPTSTQPPISAAGETRTVNVTSSPGCPWTAAVTPSTPQWITITSGASGTDSGTVQYKVDPNAGLTRTGTITIGGKTFTVTQANGCSFNFNPTNATLPAPSGIGSFDVIPSDNLCTWNSVSNDSWITVTSSTATRTGPGKVDYSVTANPGINRFGSIAVGGRLFNITQANGCTYSPVPASINVPSGGGTTYSFTVNTGGGCQWTPTSNSSWITVTGGGGVNSNSGGVTFSVAANPGVTRTGTITTTNGGMTFTVNQAGVARHAAFDYDGDNKSDLSVFRPSNGVWYMLKSSAGPDGLQFGASTDKLVPADYDGDGKTDIAVYRDGNWYIQRSTLGFTNIQFGEANDIPIPADFDADGKADLAVYRQSNGTWFVQQSTAGFTALQFGLPGDKVVAADYDGDGRADYAVFRPSTGIWYVQQSTAGFIGLQFGSIDDKLVVADYDGDGKADYAVFRPSTGFWYVRQSTTGGFIGYQFGVSTDIPVPADYDGDGKADYAVYRNDTWYLQRSTSGFIGIQYGGTGDKPIPNTFVR